MVIDVRLELRWGDQDAFNHVNNSAFLRLLEDARARAFGVPSPLPGHAPIRGEAGSPAADTFDRIPAGVLPLIGRHELEYRRPMPYRTEPVHCALWVTRVGGASFDIGYRIDDVGGAAGATGGTACDEPYLLAETGLVLVDMASGRPHRLGAESRKLLESLVDGPVPFHTRRR